MSAYQHLACDQAMGLSEAIASRLGDPETAPIGPQTADWRQQSLAYGPIGIALLHIERAAAGLGPWQRAHDWLAAASRSPLTSGADSHPFYGAPAFVHALACAADHLPGSYRRTLRILDQQMETDVVRRISVAQRRLDSRHPPALAEFDALRGLTGYGAHLLRRDPHGPAVRSILEYLVRLAEPLPLDGEMLPGWWTQSGPSGKPNHRYPGGHANSGMAHGITGPLALLALAGRRGVWVEGHREAMCSILRWLDRWREETDQGLLWPYWVTRSEVRTGRPTPSGPRRPSWCYGTAGVARAQQLAALALGDNGRQAEAETALASALTDPAQLHATTEAGVCHGLAGLAHIAARAADDALSETSDRLRGLIPPLLSAIAPPVTAPTDTARALLDGTGGDPGLLDGAAGIALAVIAPSTTAPPRSAWDACFLLA